MIMAANLNLIENANALIDTRNFQYTKVYITMMKKSLNCLNCATFRKLSAFFLIL
jgi:hypothetical protein